MNDVSVLPVLSGLHDFGRQGRVTSILDAGRPLWLTSGSAAILLALRSARVAADDEVLAPAFNCPTLVTPIRAINAKPVFYRITDRLELSGEDIRDKITTKTRAIIAPHLFGRIQDLRPLRQLCDERGLTLIEDCAHTFFGDAHDLPIGSIGHYAIASPKKFFPLAEGGVLVTRDKRVDVAAVRDAGLGKALRHGFDTLDLAVQSGKLRVFAGPISAVKRLTRGRASSTPNLTSPLVDETSSSIDSTPPPVLIAASLTTRFMARCYSHRWIARRRRENFAAIRARIESIPNLKFLDVQNPRAVPYMVPVILERPEQFAALKRRGVPMWRWEHSARGFCDVADRYAQLLIQLPCHQALSPTEIEAMMIDLAAGSSA